MAEPLSPWLVRAGLKRLLLIEGTDWKCFGPQGMVWRVHTALDWVFWQTLPGDTSQTALKQNNGGVFDLQKGDRARH
jgi:hypothetical protein